jgi:hypothetical protein
MLRNCLDSALAKPDYRPMMLKIIGFSTRRAPNLCAALLLASSLVSCEGGEPAASGEEAALRTRHQELAAQERTLQNEYQRMVESYSLIRNHQLLRKTPGTSPEQKAESVANEVQALQARKAEAQAAVDALRKELLEYRVKYL